MTAAAGVSLTCRRIDTMSREGDIPACGTGLLSHRREPIKKLVTFTEQPDDQFPCVLRECHPLGRCHIGRLCVEFCVMRFDRFTQVSFCV